MTTSRFCRRPRRRVFSQSRTHLPKIRHVSVGTLLCREVVTPYIRLRGQWLRQAGFAPHALVRVVVSTGRLELTVVPSAFDAAA